MKKIIILLAILNYNLIYSQAEKIIEYKVYKDALNISEKTNKPVLAIFYSRNCVNCELLNDLLLDSKDSLEKFIVLKLDISKKKIETYN